MKSEPPARMYSVASASQPTDFALKETSPFLGGGQVVDGRMSRADKPSTSSYDLVEQMHYLFVRLVKARDLPANNVTGTCDPFVEIKLGNYIGLTKQLDKNQNPEWNQVFTFRKDRIQDSLLNVVVKDKELVKDDIIGIVIFDVNKVPSRLSPESPLAPQWYRLEDKKGEKAQGELMLAVWVGTQEDESFPDSWNSDAAYPLEGATTAVGAAHTWSKVYMSPRLWYVRVNVIEAQDLTVSGSDRYPDVYVKARMGNQYLKTRVAKCQTSNAVWNEGLMFVAAEPFEDNLILTAECRKGPSKDEMIGEVVIPLTIVDKRTGNQNVATRWFNLEKPATTDAESLDSDKFASRIHLQLSLDGGYHVLDEPTHYCSDLRPTAKTLWRPSIGILELGILHADGLLPVKTRQGKFTSDPYCVAKYGQKWVRTRTIVNSLCPKYNEQYTWEVFDLATTLTVGVFDNGLLTEKGGKDTKIGKIRIRISMLETDRVYTNSYPLLVLDPSGVKKMGELHLAIRLVGTSYINMMYLYSRPLLPKMNYFQPLSATQLATLQYTAINIVAARLSRADPPLRKEVVEHMTDADSHLWSMRRSKVQFYRLMFVFSGVTMVSRLFGDVCTWKKPLTTVLMHVLLLILACFPQVILPMICLCIFLTGMWNYRYRPRHPAYMNLRLSLAENVHPDELDEEFDTFPTSRSADLVRMRYDRLRSVAGRLQTVVGDVATQGERVQALLSWRDPRATAIVVMLALVSAMVFIVTPLQVVVILVGFYVMRHPVFRNELPSVPLNFFRRLPDRLDGLL